MENKKYNRSMGLPGGPNEYITHISDFISTEGYKRNSPDVNNPYNIIPSGDITMEGVDFPVIGTDNLGNRQTMMPGMNYQFPGDSVHEIPLAQNGNGEERNPIYVTDPNDPRLQMYGDSLAAHSQFKVFVDRALDRALAGKDHIHLGEESEQHFKDTYADSGNIGRPSYFGADRAILFEFEEPVQPIEYRKKSKLPSKRRPKEVPEDLPMRTYTPPSETETVLKKASSKDIALNEAALRRQQPEDWYRMDGFGNARKIDPRTYNPDAGYWRREPFQKEYAQGGSLSKAQNGNGEYKVKSDDTFYGIANRNDISKEELLKLNPGINIHKLKIDQSINLPKIGFDWGGYFSGEQGLIPDYDGVPTRQMFDEQPIKQEVVEEVVEDESLKIIDEPKEQVDNKVYYNPNILNELSEPKRKRRQGLLNGANVIANSQGNNESLRRLLTLTAGMENTLGANANAYGRDYTRGPMSIDDNAYKDLFEPRGEKGRYTSSQKKNFEWLKTLGFDYTKMNDILISDDPIAGMAVARMVYGRSPEALPDASDSKALYKYYSDHYNKGGMDKYGDSDEHLKRWDKLYNDLYNFSDGGETDMLSMYSNYIDGTYDGTDMEEKASKVYDKLNRMHYKDAKAMNMSPANYVLTHIVT